MSLLLIILVLLLLCGGGWGYYSGRVGPGMGYANPVGIILFVILLLILLSFVGPWHHGYYW